MYKYAEACLFIIEEIYMALRSSTADWKISLQMTLQSGFALIYAAKVQYLKMAIFIPENY